MFQTHEILTGGVCYGDYFSVASILFVMYIFTPETGANIDNIVFIFIVIKYSTYSVNHV